VTLHTALPNKIFPSDHLALVCELTWNDDSWKWSFKKKSYCFLHVQYVWYIDWFCWIICRRSVVKIVTVLSFIDSVITCLLSLALICWLVNVTVGHK
jgi:hypothetical protein